MLWFRHVKESRFINTTSRSCLNLLNNTDFSIEHLIVIIIVPVIDLFSTFTVFEIATHIINFTFRQTRQIVIKSSLCVCVPSRGTTAVDGAGFGVDRPAELTKNDDEYDAFRKRMMLAYRFRPNPLVSNGNSL